MPFSTSMPSTNSTEMPGSGDSSTVTTPSSPTWSSASATASPMPTSSLPAIVATWRRSSRPDTGRAWPRRCATTRSVATSMPWRSSIGLAPSSIVRMPSRTIPWASSVAVVVPSPVRSLVLVATSRTSCAPMFLNGSESSISRAMLTPSLVIVGAPVRRSSTTLRPFGPSVTLTASASSSTPACRRRRASSLKWRILPMPSLPSYAAAGTRMPRPWSRPLSRSAIASLMASSGYVVVCSVTLPWAVSVIRSCRST